MGGHSAAAAGAGQRCGTRGRPNTNEAMGPALSGRNAFMLAAFSSRAAENERNTQRPDTLMLYSKGPVADVVSRVQAVTGYVNADVPRKTAYMFRQKNRHTPLLQGKIRNRFEVSNFVRQGPADAAPQAITTSLGSGDYYAAY